MSETGQARGNDKCMVLCPEVIHVKWWSVDEAVNPLLSSLLFASSPPILSFAPLVGLWLSSVPVVWHAPGDEGAVRRNSAQEVEHHLQVHINDKCKTLVLVLHNVPRKQVLPACWHTNGISVAVRASYKLHVTLTFPFLVIRPKGHFKLWDHYTYTYTHVLVCGKLPRLGFEVLQPARERKCFKADVRNILCPSEWVAPL